MTEPAELSDDELLHRAHELRRLALRGRRDVRGSAHTHEVEVRRRFGRSAGGSAPLAASQERRPFWQFW